MRSEEDESDEDESDYEEENAQMTEWTKKYLEAFDPRKNDLTFENWRRSKEDMIKKLNEQTKMRRQQLSSEPSRHDLKKRVKNVEFGVVSDEKLPEENFDNYQYAYQTWLRRKNNYEQWKKAKGNQEPQKVLTDEEMQAHKRTLHLNGFTHGEWLGLKLKEEELRKSKADLTGKKSVHFNMRVESNSTLR